MSATRLVARIDEARIRIVDQHLGVEGLVDSFVDLLLGVSETELAAEFEIYLQCRHQPALRELAHSMMAGFEQSAASTLAALGVTEPSAARAFVALVDGFALQRFAWPRGREDRAALGDGLRAFLRAYVS
ncbi:hypothetical protein [Nocardia sp. NBC_00511]|uniref:hypothetical protein n=1 Tax=Nocardia sp. NBC_00511 TaxID=2903591 RepID=UPI0030E4D3C3